MLIKYCGGRSHQKETLGRQSIYFTKENNYILDIKDQKMIDYLFLPMHNSQYRVIEREPLQEVNTIKKETIVPKKEVTNGQKKL